MTTLVPCKLARREPQMPVNTHVKYPLREEMTVVQPRLMSSNCPMPQHMFMPKKCRPLIKQSMFHGPLVLMATVLLSNSFCNTDLYRKKAWYPKTILTGSQPWPIFPHRVGVPYCQTCEAARPMFSGSARSTPWVRGLRRFLRKEWCYPKSRLPPHPRVW